MTYFGMYTVEGNFAVGQLVEMAKDRKWSWAKTYSELSKMAEIEAYGEATDTAVREYVYDACGFKEEFYIL